MKGSRGVARTSLAILALLLLACDSASIEATPTAACTEAGAQCQLPSGPLGVCERATCAEGAAPPCFRCTPQH